MGCGAGFGNLIWTIRCVVLEKIKGLVNFEVKNRDNFQEFGNKREPLQVVLTWGTGQYFVTSFGRSDASF